jgi:hypothetical protein
MDPNVEDDSYSALIARWNQERIAFADRGLASGLRGSKNEYHAIRKKLDRDAALLAVLAEPLEGKMAAVAG